MNERIKKLVKQAGGEFWQRIESDGVLNKEAYITFDPPQSLEKFAELIVRECADLNKQQMYELMGVITDVEDGDGFDNVCLTTVKRVQDYLGSNTLEKHFGVEE